MENLIKLINDFKPCCEQEENDVKIIKKNFETFDDVLTRNNEVCHFTASCFVVNEDKSKVLMIHHNIYNSWAWIGGHADGEADLLGVALRETNEETGLTNVKALISEPIAVQIITVKPHIKRGKYVSSHLHLDCCFLLEASESESLVVKEDENSGVKWIDINEVVASSNEEHMKPIYEKIIEKIKAL